MCGERREKIGLEHQLLFLIEAEGSDHVEHHRRQDVHTRRNIFRSGSSILFVEVHDEIAKQHDRSGMRPLFVFDEGHRCRSALTAVMLGKSGKTEILLNVVAVRHKDIFSAELLAQMVKKISQCPHWTRLDDEVKVE